MKSDPDAAVREEAILRELGIVRPRRFVAAMIGAHDLADPAKAQGSTSTARPSGGEVP